LAYTTVSGQSGFLQLFKRYFAATAPPFLVFELTVHNSSGTGIALSPQDSKRPEMLMVNADQAMYQAKLAGRKSFSFFFALVRSGKNDIYYSPQRN